MMMKRKLSLLLILCILASTPCASAQSLREQVAAPDNYAAQWQSKSGRLLIDVDATVEIPVVQGIPLIETTVRPFTADDALAMMRAMDPSFEGECPDYQKTFDGHYQTYAFWLSNEPRGLIIKCSHSMQNNHLVQSSARTLFASPPYDSGISPFLSEQGEAYANRYSYDEALRIATQAAQSIAPEYIMTGWGLEECLPSGVMQMGTEDTQTEFTRYPQSYIFSFTPVVDGVPQWHFYGETRKASSQYAFVPSNARLLIAVTDDGLYQIFWDSAEVYGARTPCTLLPFEQIISTAQAILPLAYANWESQYPQDGALYVDKITLSYFRVQKRDAPDGYTLLPVWDFWGNPTRRIENAEQYVTLPPYNSLMTISAIDGTVIDRNYGY